MENSIRLTENAYFFKQESVFEKDIIEELFQNVMIEKEIHTFSWNVIRKTINIHSKSLDYSLLIFNFLSHPNFVDEDACLEKEVKYAYLLIIEYKGYVAVCKKNISGLKKLYDNLDNVDYNILSKLFIEDETFFKKFSLKNMDISENAVRNKSLESSNLKNTLNPYLAGKYILNMIRLTTKHQSVTLSLNTSRINKVGDKLDIESLCKWVIETVEKIIIFEDRSTLLDMFSVPISYREYSNALNPIALILNVDEMHSDYENGNLCSIIYKYRSREREIPINSFLDVFNKNYYLSSINQINDDKYTVKNNIDRSLKLKKNKKSISLSGDKLKKIFLKYNDGDEQSLIEYLNLNNQFTVMFDKAEFVYFGRSLFRDARLLSSIDYFMSVFVPHDQLQYCTSEKGNFNKNSKNFDKSSIFGFIENCMISNTTEYLFCDDLYKEWADFIEVKSDAICFYHAKSDSVGLSASNFQVVIGQAQKNLGNFVPSKEQWEMKRKFWSTNYNADKISTKISRLRKGESVEKGIEQYIKKHSMPNAKKQVHLVINFISKDLLNKKLQDLKANKNFKEINEIIQILWFISSLVFTCNEQGVEVYIHCCP
jgi:hypothetical protein